MSVAHAIEGEMTIYRAAELRTGLLAALAGSEGDIALDLSAVTEIDSAGVQLLIAAAKSASAAQRVLHVCAIAPAVAESLRFLGLDASALLQEPA
ncbi:STAS domain-containing protein [Variovorax sp. PBL-E5]|uniref:STAS domain-containing protein n=1 Tax=Variovorax sp. PBL-E5 TaxID=434014 RepID=UPI001315B66F|nr:STAS domain-containing protein [Variovorax sp. PBL-E5]VTU33204.1 anti-anti-sigma factor [Variovorax sp. PBL-E5]